MVMTVVFALGAAIFTPTAADRHVGSSPISALQTGSAGAPVSSPNAARASEAQASEAQVVETTHQESSPDLEYSGEWSSADHPDYFGGTASWSTERGASASLTFTGIGIAWMGPTGPTRGKARIYVDGRYVKTIDSYAPRFDPSVVLFSTTYATEKTRTLEIVVVGTRGHPMVAIDALVVRSQATAEVDPPPAPSPELTPTADPTPAATSGPAGIPTPSPTAAPTPEAKAKPVPTPFLTPAPTPPTVPAPTSASSVGSSVRVTSIAALLDALDDNSVTDIVVANGTYRVSPASVQASNSLWIGARFADRTNAVTVRAESRGGVIFDGGGTTSFGGLSFEEGAHSQTWDGFTFANGQATDTGVVTFGGYAGMAAPHHITLRNITFLASCRGRSTTMSSPSADHAIYFSKAVGGPHDLLLEDITVDGSGGLSSALHFFHSDSANQNAWNVTVRRLTVNRTQQAIILWDRTVHDVTIDGASITNALSVGVRYEEPGQNIVFRNITTTGSGQSGFYSSLGSSPPGVTFLDNLFD